ncbi:hypothetical protein MNBD_PLANCTO02-437, partial [hydrothermal vent metagenome]
EAETVACTIGFLGAFVFDYQGSIDIGKELHVKGTFNGSEGNSVFVGMTSLDEIKDFTLPNRDKQMLRFLSNNIQRALGGASKSLEIYQHQSHTYRCFFNDELEITEGTVRMTLFPSTKK